MKKPAIGISDFRTVISQDYYFVDKTLFIKDVIDGFQILLYPRPRRFGKTLNLSMLRYFYDNSEDNSQLFKDLAIANETEYMKKQGKHPVIFISFKDVKSNNYDHCLDCIKDLILNEFNRHQHILQNDFMTKVDRDFFERILSNTGSLSDFENSFKKLSEYLFKYHKTNPVILIDEYDMPIQAAYINNYYEQLIEFIRNLLSGCLKDNTYLEKAVLTGILRIAKESIFSGLNNLKVMSLIVDKSADKFGFTEQEVEKCLTDYRIENKLEEVKDWYDGYNFGESTEIYNPWSILNFIDEKKLKPYWVNTSGNEMIKTLLQNSSEFVKQELEILIEGGSLHKKINDNIVYQDIATSKDALWNFLLMSGYLRFDNLELKKANHFADLKIPNKEVLYLFESEVIEGWFASSSIDYELADILQNLVSGDLRAFKYAFIEFCQSSFSYFDVGGEHPEKFYHGFVLGMITSLRDRYIIKSNRESGFGRYDIMLIPNDKGQRGIIFEFKKVNVQEKENFEIAMASAKKQIIEKRYAEELLSLGVTNIVNIAAVFEKKEVVVEIF